MEQMQILGLVALVAGVAKTAILFFSETQNKLTSAFALVCLSMILQNTFEFLVAITYHSDPYLATWLLHSEMLSIVFLAYCLLIFSLTVAENEYIRPITLLFGFGALMCTYLLLTGQLVLGYEQAGYSVISIPGPFYVVLNSFVSLAVFSMLVILIYTSLTKSGEVRSRSLQVLIAIAPVCLTALTVQILRFKGFNSSTAVFMPIATTFFVAMMVLYQSGRIVIFKIKWTVIWKLAVSMRDVKLSEWVGLVEELLVKEAMRESDNNQTEAAKLIGSNQTTVGRKFKKYEGGGEIN
ncbi:MAG: hypothetical protein COB20_10800 [SAR86 cluster bacterium]|uniref:DNA binding HTH domain-containing protein n=1 Tax=SAR86 cluster bacterium TaxID=2030880 RepID=A0A2A4X2M4_9GAMM|nr:MAG: hypothetical protein COB20_10800 [SAR86 cluster bacterium]